MGWQFMGAGGWLWMLASILFLVGVGVLTVGAIGNIGSRGRVDEATETLRARFARGEIDEDQYTKARKVLGTSWPELSRSRGGLLLGAGLAVAGLVLGMLAWASSGGYGGMTGMMGMMGPPRPRRPGRR
jgi:hypothetical protein